MTAVFHGPTHTAHAHRYSPNNRREAQRMDPAALAEAILQTVVNRWAQLAPGLGNRLFAAAGRIAPTLTTEAMRRTLFMPLTKAGADRQ
ncbi:MAG: hypothetical protein KAX65_13445 [Caldilineaceae bacterium]|nr:hypothetical protein [Caldilineaceae bacterium]